MDPVYPTEEEQRGYYSGLPSRPRLLARSSTQTWEEMHGGIPQRRSDHDPIYYRSLRPPCAHPIADMWNNPEGTLRVGLLHTLQGFPWNAIDWFGVGIHVQHPLKRTFELTMMVSVPPNLVSLSDARKAVRRCKAIIDDYGFMDIHCEIRESSISLLVDDTTSRQDTTLIHQVSTTDRNSFDSMIGTEIAMATLPEVIATKGLYIQGEYLGQQVTAALTCRHLLDTVPDNNIDIEPMKTGQTMENRELSVIQWGSGKLKQLSDLNEYSLKQKEAITRPVELRTPRDDEWVQRYLRDHKSRESFIARLNNPCDRVFGTILLSPSISLTRDPRNPWLMDWMLIQLDARRHEEELSQLSNTLLLSKSVLIFASEKASKSELFSDLVLGRADVTAQDNNPDHFLVPLRGVISIEELRRPIHDEYNDEPATRVSKLGPSSGLTFGHATTFRSVIRAPFNKDPDTTVVADMLPVVSTIRDPFSDPGDSGSCVWGMDGRIAGIVVAGSGSQGKDTCIDVTYVLPMEAILEDMKRWGFIGVV